MSVAILLPTYNEEAAIGGLIDSIRKVNKDWNIYLADSSSKDRTASIAMEKGAKVISIPGRGKAPAVKKAFEEIEDDFLVMLDGDITYPPKEIPRLLEKLNEWDVVVGSRFKGGTIEKGALTPRNWLGNKFLSLTATILYHHPVSDICSGMIAFRKSAYKKMDVRAKYYQLEPNIFVEVFKNKLKRCEIGIDYKNRLGQAKGGGDIAQGLGTFLFLLGIETECSVPK